MGNHSVDQSGYDTGEDHDREVIDKIYAGKNQNCDEQLAEVMEDASGHADAENGEQVGFTGLFSFAVDAKEKAHGSKACCGTGGRIERAKGA